jgi:molecular chaperone DnaK (HSP70)
MHYAIDFGTSNSVVARISEDGHLDLALQERTLDDFKLQYYSQDD